MARTDNTMDIMNLQLTEGENEEQLIIFNVGNEEFGLNVLIVQEIIRYTKPTRIPHASRYVEGVIDFRGEVIPVVNMRDKFGIEIGAANELSVIIVVEYSGKVLGLVVDGVSDILNLPKEKIQPAPEFTSEEKTKYLRAMGKLNERLILILDVEKILDLKEEKRLDELVSSLSKQNDQMAEND